MKIASAVTILIAVVGLTFSPVRAATNPTPAAALSELVSDVQSKLRAGPVTEQELAPELRRFDELLARYRGQQTAEVAQILFLKGTLYGEVLDQPDPAREILEQVIRDFPGTPQVARSQAVLSALEQGAAAARVREGLTVGAQFPDFAERDTTGRPLSVAQYRGKVVLVDFWAMWCGPCLAELPNVITAYNRHHADGFEIIGISLDREGDGRRLANFTAERGMPWPQYFDGGYWQTKLAVRYGVRSIPASYLIDQEGRIAAVNLRGAALDAAVARLVARN